MITLVTRVLDQMSQKVKKVSFIILGPDDIKMLKEGKPYRTDVDRLLPEAEVDLYVGFVPDTARLADKLAQANIKTVNIDGKEVQREVAKEPMKFIDVLNILSEMQMYPEIYRKR